MVTLILLMITAFLSAISAAISFGWFGFTADTTTAIGFLGLAIVAFAASAIARLKDPGFP